MVPIDLSGDVSDYITHQTMTPPQLGDNLARLVWESFTDFIADGEADSLLTELGQPPQEGGVPNERVAEEILIYHMWAHTRAVQLAFVGRASEELIRQGLDAMHGAVFEDMVENGTPDSQLPLFEQRVSARYAEYYTASDQSDDRVGEAVIRHLAPAKEVSFETVRAVTERAIIVANPLKDFLEDVDLIA